jgi:hypothetical protein
MDIVALIEKELNDIYANGYSLDACENVRRLERTRAAHIKAAKLLACDVYEALVDEMIMKAIAEAPTCRSAVLGRDHTMRYTNELVAVLRQRNFDITFSSEFMKQEICGYYYGRVEGGPVAVRAGELLFEHGLIAPIQVRVPSLDLRWAIS